MEKSQLVRAASATVNQVRDSSRGVCGRWGVARQCATMPPSTRLHPAAVPDEEALGCVPGSSLAFHVHPREECVIMLPSQGAYDLALNHPEASGVAGPFPGKCEAHTRAGGGRTSSVAGLSV